MNFVIDGAGKNKRLDVYLTEVQGGITRSRVKKLIERNHVSVNGKPSKAHYKLKAGDRVLLEIPAPAALKTAPEDIPLNIVYEDEYLLVVDKPPGMVVHPAPGHSGGTLVNAVLNHCQDLTEIGGVERPGIVHRLDKDTSGLVMIAKTDAAHLGLTKQFKERSVKKVYLAFVCRKVRSRKGSIATAIGRHKIHRKKMAAHVADGREAKTGYEVIERFEHFTYLRLFPETGRTHQIRVHLSSIKHPILGDRLYGGILGAQFPTMSRQALHAHRLELTHPVTRKPLILASPLPKDMALYLDQSK